jgi:hypothetical protein
MFIRPRFLAFTKLVLPIAAAVVALVLAEVGQTYSLRQGSMSVAPTVETLSALQPDAPTVPCEQVIGYGNVVEDSIQAPDHRCHYTFHGRAGELVAIRMVSESEGLAPHVTLLEPTERQVATGDGDSGSSSSMVYAQRLTQTGLYTIVAKAREDSRQKTGDFTLIVAQPGCGGNLGSGGVAFGATSASARTCRYTFHGLRGNALDLSLVHLNGGGLPQLELIAPNGRTRFVDVESGERVRLPISGVYTVIVRAQRREQSGPFQLTLRQTPVYYRPTQAPTQCGGGIKYGQWKDDDIQKSGETCQYTFSREGNGNVIIEMKSKKKGALLPAIYLYPPGSKKSELEHDTGKSDTISIRHRLQKDGKYKIVAGTFRGQTTGEFSIRITKDK